MYKPEPLRDSPHDAQERIAYELLLKAWGRVILEGEVCNVFAIAQDFSYAFAIDPARMLDLNWMAHQDVDAISQLGTYAPQHATH